MNLKPAIISSFVLLQLFSGPLAAVGEEGTQPGSVTLKADNLSYDKTTDIYRAIGNVSLFWDAVTLSADRAYLREAGEEATAEGRVSIKKGSDVLRCDRI